MRANEWKRLAKPSLPPDHDWRFHRKLVYRVPLHRVVLGALAEGSGFHKGNVYLWRVVTPLFVPSDVLDLSLSERVGGGSHTYDPEDVQSFRAAVSDALSHFGSEDDALHETASITAKSMANARLAEVAGYTSVLLGNLSEARFALRQAAGRTARYPWVQDLIDRSNLMLSILDREGREGGVAQLDRWCDDTATAIGMMRIEYPR